MALSTIQRSGQLILDTYVGAGSQPVLLNKSLCHICMDFCNYLTCTTFTLTSPPSFLLSRRASYAYRGRHCGRTKQWCGLNGIDAALVRCPENGFPVIRVFIKREKEGIKGSKENQPDQHSQPRWTSSSSYDVVSIW